MAQNPVDRTDKGRKQKNEMFCAAVKDGKIAVMSEGKKIVTAKTLDNGDKLKTDGTIIKKDGSETFLKEGECINRSGKIEKSNMPMRTEPEKKKSSNKSGYES